MVIPLLGVKTRCADKSTAEHYEHTYIHTYIHMAPTGQKYRHKTMRTTFFAVFHDVSFIS